MQMRQTFHFWRDMPEIKGNCLAFIAQLPSNDKWQVTIERIEPEGRKPEAARMGAKSGKDV